MSAARQKQVAELEQAILDRARDLAAEIEDKACHRRDTILRETNERLNREEERENHFARGAAERTERRLVQATELRLQGQLDQLRWELVQAVSSRLAEQMRALRDDRDAYREWLIDCLKEADQSLPEGDLSAEVIAEDHLWLSEEWEALCEPLKTQRHIELNNQPTWGTGGIKLRTADNTAQLDNRFEGRLSRYETAIQRTILQRLFPDGGGMKS